MSSLQTLLLNCRSSIADIDAVTEEIARQQASRPQKAPPVAIDRLASLTDNSEADIEPRKAAGVSRATYFRQQAKGREGDPFIPQIMMLWCALQLRDQLTAGRVCVRILQSKERPTADARTVDAVLRAAIKQARKSRGER